jgi:stearoyl-CoA desaturase (delta-9 desaturase)
VNIEFLYGVLGLGFWGYVIAAAISLQITIVCVTVYLHRDATHRSVDLHPAIRHFARFWIWFTAAMLTREWVAVHRKHHAKCETADDPHSPVIYGLKKVLFEGAELYQVHARDPETLEKYGRGTPDDWLERNVYTKHRNFGILTLIVLDLVMFGVPGIIIIAAQMLAMPLLAAGVINGVGHHGLSQFRMPRRRNQHRSLGRLAGRRRAT